MVTRADRRPILRTRFLINAREEYLKARLFSVSLSRLLFKSKQHMFRFETSVWLAKLQSRRGGETARCAMWQ